MESMKKLFGAKIKELREKRGLNQEQLAEIIGIESRHLSRIETGKNFTTIETIAKIADALDSNIDSLFVFQHKKDKKYLVDKINKYLSKANDSQVELAFRLMQIIFE